MDLFATDEGRWLRQRIKQVLWFPETTTPVSAKPLQEIANDLNREASAKTPGLSRLQVRVLEEAAQREAQRAAQVQVAQQAQGIAFQDAAFQNAPSGLNARAMSVADYNAFRDTAGGQHLPYVHQEYPKMLVCTGRSATTGEEHLETRIVKDAIEHQQALNEGWRETGK